MKKNIGRIDSFIRIALAVFIFYFIDSWSGSVQLVFGIVAAVLVFTALNRFCLLYVPFKISTAKKNPKQIP